MKRILSVDDEAAILRCFEKALKMKGYQVTTTSDPHEALRIIREEDVDLITLDVRMPAMSGFEIYEQLKTKKGPVPVLFVTAYPASFTAESDAVVRMWTEQFAEGLTDILYKPFDVDTLIEKVEGLIGTSE